MSIKIMTMVFDRYHAGGGEMLLALALADHAHDDGTNVRPGIKSLAEKTRQSERTVQYQLRRMEESGWLILVNSGNGGRNQRREYVICPDWVKGANIAPPRKGAIHDLKGAADDTKGCNPQQERVQPVAPAYNRHRNINEPSENHKGADAPENKNGAELDFSSWPEKPSPTVWRDYKKLRMQKKAPVSQTVIDRLGIEIRKAARLGFGVDDFLSECVLRGWQGGKAEWLANRQHQPPGGKFDPLAYVNKNRTNREAGNVIDV